MLILNLQKIFRLRGIEQPYKFLVKNGFVPFTAHKYKTGKVEAVRINHIEQLCKALHCTPNDLFEWMPDDLLDDRPDHPLQKLRISEKKSEINKMLSKLPLEKLGEVESLLKQLI